MSEVTNDIELLPAHATLGASSSERWMACPGSVRMSEGRPEYPSIYKQEGTAAHEIAARALKTGRDPSLWVGTVVEVEDAGETFEIEITDEMAEAAAVFVDYVNGVVSRLRDRGAEVELYIETRIDLSRLNPPALMYGRADAGIVARLKGQTAIEVADFKYGQGKVVEVDDNSQGQYYALGFTIATRVKGDIYKVTIVQPRAPHRDGVIRSEKFTWGRLVAFKKELFTAAEVTLDPNAPLVFGDHCKFCPALAVCPAQRAMVEEVAQAEFSTLPVLAKKETTPLLPAPAELTKEQLVEVMEKGHLITSWVSAVHAHVKTLTEGGEDLGYKLVPKRGTRRWLDEPVTEEWLTQHLGDETFTRKLKSPAQAEAALKEIAMKLPEAMWHKVSSGTNLAPNDDPREAVAPPLKADDEFAEYLPLVEGEYVPDIKNAVGEITDGIDVPKWAATCHRDDLPDLEIMAVNETDARREVRTRWGVKRLPNNTTVHLVLPLPYIVATLT